MDRASSSDSSSDSPPRNTGPEDDVLGLETPDALVTSFGKETFTMANLKRHYSGRPAAFGGFEGAREPKSRRKDPRSGSGSANIWEQGSMAQGRQRDELVDNGLVEQLRNQFGDPFDDTILKAAAGSSS